MISEADGRRVMNNPTGENQDQLDKKINYIILAQRRYGLELVDEREVHINNASRHGLESDGDPGTSGDEMNTDKNDDKYDAGNEDNMDLEYSV